MFGLIIAFATFFLIAIATILWGVFSKRNEKNNIEKFIKKFENINQLGKEHLSLLNEIDLNSLSNLARVFAKSGDFEKAISIYLLALKKSSTKPERSAVLTALGKIYLKAGFLKKSAEIFLETLKLLPRNTEALSHLTIIYEKLKMYHEAKETIVSLNEQGVEIKEWNAYLSALEILTNKDENDKINKIIELSKDFELLKRLALEQSILRHETPLIMPKLDDCIDLIFLDPKYNDFMRADKNSPYYFNIKLLEYAKEKKLKATLSFNYVCNECKNTYPLFFYRCPNCTRLGSAKILSNIIEEKDEESATF